MDSSKLGLIEKVYPFIKKTTNYLDVLKDPTVDAVCISTPATTHYKIAKDALLYGKHILIEKPMSLCVDEGRDLVETAKDKNRVLVIGHVYLYHSAVQWIKRFISSGEIGDVYYLYSTRTGLGPIRKDVNAMWDLATHDISICLYLLDCMPVNVSAKGFSYLQNGIEDVVFLVLEFPEKIVCHIHASWLDPYKIRRLTIVGSKKMLVFNDTDLFENLKILDKGASVKETHTTYEDFLLQVRTGDIHIPKVESVEPLKSQCIHFLNCLKKGVMPLTNGEESLKVIQVLEAANKSLKNGGISVEVRCR